MTTKTTNLFDVPKQLFEKEVFEDVFKSKHVRVERILSLGHSSPAKGWYDQNENEWVVILQGAGVIEFENGEKIKLVSGESVNIPAHTKHRVDWTDPKQITIWLAVFYL